MISFIFEFIWQIFFEWFLGFPGAFLLWSITGFNGPFNKIYAENINKSAAIGFCIWVLSIYMIGILANSPN